MVTKLLKEERKLGIFIETKMVSEVFFDENIL